MVHNYSLDTFLIVMIGLGVSVFLAFLALLLAFIIDKPFQYPYFIFTFDVTSKRNVKIENYIDKFLCNPHNWHLIQIHEQHIQAWKTESENYLRTCRLRKLRTRQYQAVLDDAHAYHFKTIRNQTRYQQQNYVKTSYTASVVDSEWVVSIAWLTKRYKQLEKIGFEATLNDYNSTAQRKLMTRSLRKQIMERDGYTCQNCGKYMPDEVGLQIDHIIPIAKGGKSVPSNLQVLCSKCNGSKGVK